MVPPGTHFSNVAVERTIPVKFEIMMAAESATNPGINLQPLWMANATRWCEPIDSKHIFLTSSSPSASNFTVHYFDKKDMSICTVQSNWWASQCNWWARPSRCAATVPMTTTSSTELLKQSAAAAAAKSAVPMIEMIMGVLQATAAWCLEAASSDRDRVGFFICHLA